LIDLTQDGRSQREVESMTLPEIEARGGRSVWKCQA